MLRQVVCGCAHKGFFHRHTRGGGKECVGCEWMTDCDVMQIRWIVVNIVY